MIKEIFTYVAKREVYSQFLGFKNSTADAQLKTVSNAIKTLLYGIWAAMCLFFSYQFGVLEGVAIFVAPVALLKCLSGLYSLTRKTTPVYSDREVYKSDRRFKGGKRLSHYEQVVVGVRPLSDLEIGHIRKEVKLKLLFWGILLIASSGVLIYVSN